MDFITGNCLSHDIALSWYKSAFSIVTLNNSKNNCISKLIPPHISATYSSCNFCGFTTSCQAMFTLKMEPEDVMKRWYPTTTLHDVTNQKASIWRRRQHGPMKRWYHTTKLHIVTTQNTSTWRRKQHGPMKRWYPTITLHGVTTQKTSTWRWSQRGPLKRWYPTTTLHDVTNQKTSTWNATAVRTLSLASKYFCLFSYRFLKEGVRSNWYLYSLISKIIFWP